SPALSGGVPSGRIQRLAIASSSPAETTPPYPPIPVGTGGRRSVQAGLDRALDLEDGRFASRDPDDLVEDAHRISVQRLLRQPHIGRRAVRENKCWRAEHAVLAAGLQMVARKRVQDAGISKVGAEAVEVEAGLLRDLLQDRKSTRLNSSHVSISYAVFCLKKKKKKKDTI